MGFTFDSPISHSYSAYDKAHRTQSTAYNLPLPKPRITLLDKLRRKGRTSFGGFGSPPSSLAVGTARSIIPVPAKESRFFRLPLAVREKIYGYLVGQDELLHILLRYRARPSRWKVAYRRCAAGGDVDYCVMHRCREFHDFVKASYFGYFDHVGGLFLTCQDIYKEASDVLYSQNTLEFDHPLSLIILSREVSPSSLKSIRSISIDLQKQFYIYKANNFHECTSFHPDQWLQLWNVISTMQGLEEIRVRFKLLINGWMGWTEEEALEPLCKVRQTLRVFEVEMPSLFKGWSSSGDKKETDVPFTLVKY